MFLQHLCAFLLFSCLVQPVICTIGFICMKFSITMIAYNISVILCMCNNVMFVRTIGLIVYAAETYV